MKLSHNRFSLAETAFEEETDAVCDHCGHPASADFGSYQLCDRCITMDDHDEVDDEKLDPIDALLHELGLADD